MTAMWWFTMGWCFAMGYAATTLAYATRRAPLTRSDTALTVGIITANTVGALVFIFGRDEGPALVCAGIIALVGAAYHEQGRRWHEAAATMTCTCPHH